MRRVKVRVGVFAALTMLVACAAAEPHIHNPAEFDRDHRDFAKSGLQSNNVTVCYSKYRTTPAQVADQARRACGALGLGIRFMQTEYDVCPLVTPIGAQFECVGGSEPVARTAPAAWGGEVRDVQPVTGLAGQPGAPLSGYRDGARPMGYLFGRGQPATQTVEPSAPPAPAQLPVSPQR